MFVPYLGQRVSFETYQGRPAGEGIVVIIWPYKAIFGKDKGKELYNLGIIPDVKHMYDYRITSPGEQPDRILTEYFDLNEWEDDWDEDENPVTVSEYRLKEEYTGYYIESNLCTPLYKEYTPEQSGDTDEDV
jgi:hypothetical protein